MSSLLCKKAHVYFGAKEDSPGVEARAVLDVTFKRGYLSTSVNYGRLVFIQSADIDKTIANTDLKVVVFD